MQETCPGAISFWLAFYGGFTVFVLHQGWPISPRGRHLLGQVDGDDFAFTGTAPSLLLEAFGTNADATKAVHSTMANVALIARIGNLFAAIASSDQYDHVGISCRRKTG